MIEKKDLKKVFKRVFPKWETDFGLVKLERELSNLLFNTESKESPELFEQFRKRYRELSKTVPGQKKAWEYFTNKYGDDIETVKLLLPALEHEAMFKSYQTMSDGFAPQWKNFRTWINNRCWEEEHIIPPEDEVIMQVLEIWSQSYLRIRTEEYLISQKDYRSISQMLKSNIEKYPDITVEERIRRFTNLFETCLELTDNFSYDLMSPNIHFK